MAYGQNVPSRDPLSKVLSSLWHNLSCSVVLLKAVVLLPMLAIELGSEQWTWWNLLIMQRPYRCQADIIQFISLTTGIYFSSNLTRLPIPKHLCKLQAFEIFFTAPWLKNLVEYSYLLPKYSVEILRKKKMGVFFWFHFM